MRSDCGRQRLDLQAFVNDHARVMGRARTTTSRHERWVFKCHANWTVTHLNIRVTDVAALLAQAARPSVLTSDFGRRRSGASRLYALRCGHCSSAILGCEVRIGAVGDGVGRAARRAFLSGDALAQRLRLEFTFCVVTGFTAAFCTAVLGAVSGRCERQRNQVCIHVAGTYRPATWGGVDPVTRVPDRGDVHRAIRLFSAPGAMADKMEKSRLIRLLKDAEIAVMTLAAIGLVFQWPVLIYVAIFLIGLASHGVLGRLNIVSLRNISMRASSRAATA